MGSRRRKYKERFVALVGLLGLAWACSATDPKGSNEMPEAMGGYSCADDPACDDFGDDSFECDVTGSGRPLEGGAGGLLNDLGGAGGQTVCLELAR